MDGIDYEAMIKRDFAGVVDKIEITPFDEPWEVACRIINAKYEDVDIFNQKQATSFFPIEKLRKIGEHIVNYCNTEQETKE